jgi:hypothetical protein
MRPCPKKIRRLFYGYSHGFESFCEVEASLEILLKNSHLPEPILHALTTSVAIDFIRPFKQQGPQMRLDKEIIPDEFRPIFDYFELLRDKSFAHIDSNDFTGEDGERNQVLLRSYDDGFAPFLRRAAVTAEQAKALVPLLAWLSNYSMEKFTGIINEYPVSETPFGNFLYEVDIDRAEELPLYTRRII